MNQCFVIQPFDADKFNKRYKDVYAPAIIAGGFVPYRVDIDVSAEIPIESIDDNLRTSSAVLADITLNNPNVWFEVGLAIAYKKKTILICSDERKDKYPFDIQQRTIIPYKTGSSSDYDDLKNKIIDKLKYFAKQPSSVVDENNNGQILSENIMSDEALLLLGVVGKNVLGKQNFLSLSFAADEFEKCGYNRLAFNFALEELCGLGFIKQTVFEYGDIECNITSEGFSWMRKNKSRFNLTAEKKSSGTRDSIEPCFSEDVPF